MSPGCIPSTKYAGKYSGRTARHKIGTQFLACADCHNVHTGDVKANPGIFGGMDCLECHGAGMSYDYANIAATIQTFSDQPLADTMPCPVQCRQRHYTGSTWVRGDHLRTVMLLPRSAPRSGQSRAIYADFTHYDENAWAHNNKFAKQLMYDAIEALGGDPSVTIG